MLNKETLDVLNFFNYFSTLSSPASWVQLKEYVERQFEIKKTHAIYKMFITPEKIKQYQENINWIQLYEHARFKK